MMTSSSARRVQRRHHVAGLALVIAALVSPALIATEAHAATIAGSPTPSVQPSLGGEQFELSGTLGHSLPRRAFLQRRVEGRWRRVSSSFLPADGSYQFTVSQTKATTWRVVAPAVSVRKKRPVPRRFSRSVTTGVAERQQVDVAWPSATVIGRERVSIVRLTPARPGRSVRMEFLQDDQWQRIGEGAESAHGIATVPWTPTTAGTFPVRITVSGFRGAAEGHSPMGSVAVFPHAVEVAGHRGASNVRPENTIPAFEEAVDAGAQWLEADLQQTKDGAWILMHDGDLRRTTNVVAVFGANLPSYAPSAFTLSQIRQLDAGAWKGAAFQGTRVPTLDELLDLVARSHVRAMLEAKTGSPTGLYDAVAAAQPGLVGPDKDDAVLFASFTIGALKALHDARPFADTAVLANDAPDLATISWADQLQLFANRLTSDTVRAAHERGLKLVAWTINTAADMVRFGLLGIDIVITNDPRLGSSTLSQ